MRVVAARILENALDRRTYLARAIAIVALAVAATAYAAYPEKPIKLVTPFPAGGPTDVLGRQLVQALSTSLGQSVVVENKAGGNSTIDSDEARVAARLKAADTPTWRGADRCKEAE